MALKTNYRQGEGDPWTNLLNRVRIGEHTTEDIAILQSREHSLLSKKQYEKATHLFYPNKESMVHNDSMLNTLSTDLIQTEAACDVPLGSGYKPQVNEWGLIYQTNFSMNLQLQIGARILVVFNINILDNLVNGAFGTVINILFNRIGEADSIIVSFDNPETGLEQRREFKNISEQYDEQRGVPIYKSSTEYYINFKGRKVKSEGRIHGANCKVTQFPLRLAWATTGHRVQGVSIKKGTNVVIHGHKRMPYQLMYMMLSRAESKDNVFLENFDPKQIRADPKALEEEARLDTRSIVPLYENMHFKFFVLNVQSLSKHFQDIMKDMFAQKSDHVCLLETLIDPKNVVYNDFEMSERSFYDAPVGKRKGCGIFSNSSDCMYKKLIKNNYQMLSIIDGSVQMILFYISSNCAMKDVAKTVE